MNEPLGSAAIESCISYWEAEVMKAYLALIQMNTELIKLYEMRNANAK